MNCPDCNSRLYSLDSRGNDRRRYRSYLCKKCDKKYYSTETLAFTEKESNDIKRMVATICNYDRRKSLGETLEQYCSRDNTRSHIIPSKPTVIRDKNNTHVYSKIDEHYYTVNNEGIISVMETFSVDTLFEYKINYEHYIICN